MINIICDGGAHGFGHISRAVAIGWALKARGLKVKVKALSSKAKEVIPNHPKDEGEPVLTIIDIPGEEEISKRIISEKSKGRKVVTIEYYGQENHDLMIEIFGSKKARHSSTIKSGLKYAIVREELRKQKLKKRISDNSVLIMIGGSDLLNQSEAIANKIKAIGDNPIVIEGPLKSSTRISDYLTLKNPSNLSELMHQCKWGITNGGVTLLEMLYLGKPVYVAPQTSSEMNLAKFLLAKNCLLGIGLNAIQRPTEKNVQEILANASTIIDGNGIDRIATIVSDIL